ncbi:peptidyl-prolyl cis-trans isomerase CYP57 isoform X1 [Nicotiana tabacum]|uniref:Peptidyl-prolyl cis-trans isomerase CYP57 isoform X1 n=1 Tax=Nicotiana tabacum TaxID=4097 RepID=A0A1S4C7S4_TOBAC|nr:PREDICTED: peptidyl-prolyl cis-trans isomerase CYP57 isoform X1 [Nicotiana tabacum]
MSTVYVLEPPTKGKVVLNTTYGPIDIELWPKEAPKAVRNFVQLCLEGYYDNTIFHRVIKSFLVQGGDPTGTGTGGESIYGGVFPDEFHSRLRFKHRGLVACAGADSPNSNASQFFMTLDRCDFLDKKHTIFGKVSGDSIYNLITLGEVETGKDDRPVDPPPKILSVEVLWNPFEDIVPRAKLAKALPSEVTTEKKDAKHKATKKLNLLSFGEEAEEEEKELAAVSTRIRSSHDVLDDPRLLKEEKHDQALDSNEGKSTRDVQLTIREALGSKKEASRKESEAGFHESLDNSDEDEAGFDARMRQQILKRRKELGDPPPKQKLLRENGNARNRSPSSPRCSRSDAEHDDDRPKVDKLALKRKGIGSEARAERMANADTDLQLLSGPERERQLLKQKRRGRKGHEEDVLAKLEKFKSGVFAKSNGSTNAGKEEELSDWAAVTLKFAPEPGKDKMSRTEDPNDYVVHDPLLEKGKEKFNKMMAKQKRREREWAGKSLT